MNAPSPTNTPLTTLVLTCIGPDKPGLVEALSLAIASRGANWEQSTMARMAGHFAGILLVQVSETHVNALLGDLEKLGAQGLQVIASRDRSSQTPCEAPRTTANLELVGHDRPGIVRNITALLARLDVNIESLQTSCESAPMSGDLLFRATAALQIPNTLSLQDLHHQLESIAGDLMVDISLEENT